MAKQALFEGLVFDETETPAQVRMVGGEAFYVVDDQGFQRHVESESVDRQVIENLMSMIEGNESLIAEGTMKMLGQEDIFTKAAIELSLRRAPEQTEQLLAQGLPSETRVWLGMIGFRVVIDLHGEVVRVDQPQSTESPEE